MKRRVLLVGPYVGEFGWELMNWQGRVRYLARFGGFDRVIVAAPADRQSLFASPEDARIELRAIELPALPGEANEDHRIGNDGRRVPANEIRQILTYSLRGIASEEAADEIELLLPSLDGRLWPTAADSQTFAEIRRPGPVTTDVLLIPRRRDAAIERNRLDSWWDEVFEALTDRGLRVERYGGDLNEAIEQLSRARLAIGGSTGGLHLASLCRCPHYVWGCDSSQRWTGLRMSNRQRYETFWNPLGTPVIYDEVGWSPGRGHVVERACTALDRIGLPRGDDRRGSPSMSWRLRRGLARIVESGDRWPWRLRRLVHEALV